MNALKSFFAYLEFEKRYSDHTIKAYRSDIDQFVNYLQTQFEQEELGQAEHFQIRSWIVHMMQEGVVPRSVNRKISSLRSFYKFCQKRGIFNINPMQKVVAPKIGKRLPKVLQANQVEQLFKQVDFGNDYEGIRDRMILETFYQTGIRRSELINIKLDDIDRSNLLLKVLGKGNKERLIPLLPRYMVSIDAYLKYRDQEFPNHDNYYLFLSKKGDKMYPKLAYNLVNKYLKIVSSVDHMGPHILRHSFATHLSDNGAELNALKELLGHANLAATQIYTHNSIEKLKKAYIQAHPKSRNKD